MVDVILDGLIVIVMLIRTVMDLGYMSCLLPCGSYVLV
jgi:hypothetical protein